MQSRKIGGVILALVLAGAAYAMAASMVENMYGGGMKDISIAKANLNHLRSELEGASAEDLVASLDEITRVLEKEIPDQFGLLLSGLKSELTNRNLPAKELPEKELDELSATIAIFSEETAASMRERGFITDAEYFVVIQQSMAAISEGGGAFLLVAEEQEGSPLKASAIQTERANLSLDMARFDVLIAYFVILVEKAGA